jgi:hypothetical protein
MAPLVPEGLRRGLPEGTSDVSAAIGAAAHARASLPDVKSTRGPPTRRISALLGRSERGRDR